MQKIRSVFSLFLLLAGIEFPLMAETENIITITPGSSLSLTPGVETTVKCEGSSALQHVCLCELAAGPLASYHLVDVMISPDGNEAGRIVLIGGFSSQDICFRNLKEHPICSSN
ncbi:MAG: hypothetical protein HY391_01070 [Deltaproteobacteria bacterium]|nr:hypothetical protein [Deltaproteobacteria bacterium]